MDPKQIAASAAAEGSDLCPQATAFWRKISAQISKIPITARVLLCFFLFAAVLMGIHTALAGKDSSFRLKVQHSFRGAQLSVWVDGDLTYSARLIGTPVMVAIPPTVTPISTSLTPVPTIYPSMPSIKVQASSHPGHLPPMPPVSARRR